MGENHGSISREKPKQAPSTSKSAPVPVPAGEEAVEVDLFGDDSLSFLETSSPQVTRTVRVLSPLQSTPREDKTKVKGSSRARAEASKTSTSRSVSDDRAKRVRKESPPGADAPASRSRTAESTPKSPKICLIDLEQISVFTSREKAATFYRVFTTSDSSYLN